MKLRLSLVLLLTLWSCFAFPAENHTVNWAAPTENTDGTRLTDLGGFTIYWGPQPGVYVDSVEVPDPFATSTTIRLDAPISETVYLAMTAWNTEEPRKESAYSNELSVDARDRMAPIINLILRKPSECEPDNDC